MPRFSECHQAVILYTRSNMEQTLTFATPPVGARMREYPGRSGPRRPRHRPAGEEGLEPLPALLGQARRRRRPGRLLDGQRLVRELTQEVLGPRQRLGAALRQGPA